MNYKTHVMGGVLLGLLPVLSTSNILNIEMNKDAATFLIYMGSIVVGSMLPDIDHSGSYIGRRLKPLAKLINTTLGHRGATHSPFLILLFSCILHLLNKLIWVNLPLHIIIVGLFIGMMSHVFLDLLTKEGVPFLYPFSKKKFSLIGITTGGFIESTIFALLVGVSLYLITKVK